jgi:hypothetical protein
MEVAMLLCDAAEAVNGKLYILGAGWSQLLLPDTPVNMSLAVKIAVPWHEANDPHEVVAKLVDGDGHDVTVVPPGAPEGAEPIRIRNQVTIETGRPPGLVPGTALDAPLVFNFGGLPLPTGSYVWELEVDGTVEARAPFRVGPVQRRVTANE